MGIDLPYYIKNGLWVGIGQAIQAITGIGLSIILARFTTEEVLGQYNFLLSILSIVSLVTMPGANISLIRSIARNNHGVYKKSFRFSFLWSMTGIPILLFISMYYYMEGNLLFSICIASTLLFLPLIYPFEKWSSLLQGITKFDLFTLYNSLKTLLIAGFIISSVFLWKNNVFAIFSSYLISNSLVNILFYLYAMRFITNNNTDKEWKESAYRLSLIALISNIYDHADKVLIGIFFEPQKLAIYSIAASIITYFRTFIKMFIRVILPKLFAADENLLRSVLRRFSFKFIIVLGISSGMAYFILPYLIPLLYSEKYIPSILYTQIYLLSIPACGLVMFLQNYLIAFKAEGIMIKIKIVFSIINLLLYVALIPTLGILGAILSSIAYYVLLALVYSYFSYRK